MRTEIEELEDKSFFEEDSTEVPPSDIVAYNELRSCADLFRMYTQEILKIQPEFQRELVWKGPDQSRFIDSLIKQLPIPSMCFSYDPEKQEWMVIDGLQRISTIIKFLEGGDWNISKLDDIDQNISGKSVAAIKVSDSRLHKYYSRVENLSIPVTVLRCDHTKKSHLKSSFKVALNATSLRLNRSKMAFNKTQTKSKNGPKRHFGFIFGIRVSKPRCPVQPHDITAYPTASRLVPANPWWFQTWCQITNSGEERILPDVTLLAPWMPAEKLHLSYTKRKKGLTNLAKPLISLVPRDRIELPTRGFSVPCSTD